jgi:hypothetical protein
MAASRTRAHAKLVTVFVLVLLAFALVACGPEANRVDGDGEKSGADVGNWGDPVQLHGDDTPDESIYYKTPDELPAE